MNRDEREAAAADAVHDLWQRFQPVARERVALLEQNAEALADGSASPEVRRECAVAAHKLAGALGTYGRRGSREARRVELAIESGVHQEEIPALVAGLRAAVESRPLS